MFSCKIRKYKLCELLRLYKTKGARYKARRRRPLYNAPPLALNLRLCIMATFASVGFTPGLCQETVTPSTLVTSVPLWPLPEKAFRRRKAGWYSVKKFVLFERSEFTNFRNIAWLFGPRIEMETVSYSYESRSLAEQVSVLEASGLDLLFTFVAMTKENSAPCIPESSDVCKAKGPRLRFFLHKRDSE